MYVFVEGQTPDPCSFTTGTIPQLSACLANIPFKRAQARITHAFFRKMLRLNVFTELYKKGIAPYNINVNIPALLNAALAPTVTYPTEFAMETAVHNIVELAADAHFEYFPPLYQIFFASRTYDVGLVAAGTSGADPIVNLVGCSTFLPATDPCFNFVDQPIQTINGVPAFQYILSLARSLRLHPDESISLNYILESYPSIDLSSFAFNADDILVIGGTTLTLPNIARNRFQDTVHILRNLNQQYHQLKNSYNLTALLKNQDDSQESLLVRRLKDSQNLFPTLASPAAPSTSNPSGCVGIFIDPAEVQNIYVCNYTSNEQVLVLEILSFSPDVNNITFYIDQWINLTIIAHASGITKLVVHTHGNGGGFALLSYILAAIIAQPSASQLSDDYDAQVSRVLQELLAEGNAHPLFWSSSGSLLSQTKWYDSRVTRRYPHSHTITFTREESLFVNPKTQYPLAELITVLFNPQQESNTTYLQRLSRQLHLGPPFKKILLLTDSICISTCSVFTTKMENLRHAGLKNYKLRVAAYGGSPNTNIPFDTSVGAGGTVLGVSFYTAVPYLELLVPDSNPPFPRQFTRIPADVYLPVWQEGKSFDNKLALYSQGIAQFANF